MASVLAFYQLWISAQQPAIRAMIHYKYHPAHSPCFLHSSILLSAITGAHIRQSTLISLLPLNFLCFLCGHMRFHSVCGVCCETFICFCLLDPPPDLQRQVNDAYLHICLLFCIRLFLLAEFVAHQAPSTDINVSSVLIHLKCIPPPLRGLQYQHSCKHT